MKLGLLFSGGKDSCLTLHKAIQEGHSIDYLLSVIPENFDSFMFHKPYLNLLKRQAQELGIKLITIKSKGIQDKELEDLANLIKKVKGDIEGVCVGGIASNYQGNRIKKICENFNLKFYAPLWNYSSEDLWRELLKENFKIILTKISCEGLTEKWIGKVIDKDSLEELFKLSKKYKFRADFEGGEAESAVLNMPEFKNEILFDYKIKKEDKYRYFVYDLKLK